MAGEGVGLDTTDQAVPSQTSVSVWSVPSSDPTAMQKSVEVHETASSRASPWFTPLRVGGGVSTGRGTGTDDQVVPSHRAARGD